ncbi:MAG: hypothetical protein MUC95_04110 [Spirochaetes bacterium]|nr:hypothetical protein [Spirochaetota bacterium]
MNFLNQIRLIQGGMGIYVSNWKLARAAAMSSPDVIAGTVSGTALDQVYVRLLQEGDPGGHIKRAFDALDSITGSDFCGKLYERYHILGGKSPEARYRPSPRFIMRFENGESHLPAHISADTGPVRLMMHGDMIELLIASAFSEVWLAKEGHRGRIFINFLKKIEAPLVCSIYGAILAGADGIVVGAGNPDGLPALCGELSMHREVSMEFPVLYKEPGEKFILPFNPAKYISDELKKTPVRRPAFLSIVSHETLARALAESGSGAPDGLIIENHTAGGHNANPLGPLVTDELGQPVYGENDMADIRAIKKTRLPFWLAGGYDSSEKMMEALDAGANGIQSGTIYAFSEESGMLSGHRAAVFNELKQGKDDQSIIRTTMYSPTGFSFKVAVLNGTLSQDDVYIKRKRVCDIGLLQQVGLSKPDENGMRKIFQRCPAAPLGIFVKKRGLPRNTEERRCLCNGLISGAGYAQVVENEDGTCSTEPPIVTAGGCLNGVRRMSQNGSRTYTCSEIAGDILG